jgi:hypothetical protein
MKNGTMWAGASLSISITPGQFLEHKIALTHLPIIESPHNHGMLLLPILPLSSQVLICIGANQEAHNSARKVGS